MARVVRQRKNPLLPVLLIFVFLFLIAAVMATLFYNHWKEDAKGGKQVLTARRKIISDAEMRDGAIQKIISEYNKGRGKAPTVVAVLTRRIAELTRKITGSSTTAAVAIQQIESEPAIGRDTFILNAISTAKKANADQSGKIKELEDALKNLAANQQDAVAAYKKLQEQFTAKATELAGEVQELMTDNSNQAKAHAAALKASDAEWQGKLTKQEQEVDTLAAQVNQLTETNRKQALKIEVLTKLVRQQKKTRPIDMAVREAGRIKEIMPKRDVCFIPLGSRDRIVRGMTFRVYGPEGIPSDGEGHKAALTVIRVFKTISQCRVSTVDEKDPVAVGDPFANIAFDPTHQPVFVVEGRFDLSGMGRLTETGTQEVLSLIKRAGGKIAGELSVDVDFVVMGPEPSRPPKLDDDEPGPAKKAWEIRNEEYNRWHKTLSRAVVLNIPKLNTRRFMTLIGYETVREYEE